MQEETFIANGKRYIVASKDVNKTVRDLVRVAAEAVGSNMGALLLLDQHRKVLKPAVIANLPEGVHQRLRRGPSGRAVLRKGSLTRNTLARRRHLDQPVFSTRGTGSCAASRDPGGFFDSRSRR
jgi:hypothetical protein